MIRTEARTDSQNVRADGLHSLYDSIDKLRLVLRVKIGRGHEAAGDRDAEADELFIGD